MYWFVITISCVAISNSSGSGEINVYCSLPNVDIVTGIEDGITGTAQKSYDFSFVLCGFPGRNNRDEWQIISGKGYNSSDYNVNYFYVTSPFYYSSNMSVTNAYGGNTCHYTQNNLTVYRQKINSL